MAAQYLQISKSKLYKLTSLKKIPFFKPTKKQLLFKLDDLDKYVQNSRVVSLEMLQQTTI
ncbi:MAG: helix-turn-helix domain-containing protein [Cyclobacteriaceae bacterium]|nr:helix-turn-helix domain-containing protein [Cyclobacteriaceae bacterium]